MGEDRLKRLVPVFEEGTVDEDLLNEGNRRLRDYFQRQGYFDVKVDHTEQSPEGGPVTITYKVTLGARRKVEKVSVCRKSLFQCEDAGRTAERSRSRPSGPAWNLQPGPGGGGCERGAGGLPEQRILKGEGDAGDVERGSRSRALRDRGRRAIRLNRFRWSITSRKDSSSGWAS